MLLGLHGPARSGKDQSLQFIRELLPEVNVVRDAFADRLKLSAARIFHPEIELEEAVTWCNSLKDENTRIMRTTGSTQIGHANLGVEAVFPEEKITGRVFLQRYGTEAHRNVFGTDFWTKQVLPGPVYDDSMRPDGRADLGLNDLLVITDCRFPNEAEHIRACGGQVWAISRPQVLVGDTHASEKPLDERYIDVVIDNSGTLDDLRERLAFSLLVQFGF